MCPVQQAVRMSCICVALFPLHLHHRMVWCLDLLSFVIILLSSAEPHVYDRVIVCEEPEIWEIPSKVIGLASSAQQVLQPRN